MDEFVSPNQGKKTNWFLITTVLLIILVVILISIILIFSFQKPMKISNEELSAGKSFELKKGQTAIFTVNNEEHKLKVDSITSNSITVIIQSDKITITLQVGEDKEIDLDKDGKKDIKIELEEIENNKPIIKIIKIEDNQIGEETPECNENWNCSQWTECSSNTQSRTCSDLNNCGSSNNKPSEIQDCSNNCIEDWECNNWTSCLNNQQTRTCTDNNDCGTSKNKPSETQSCSTFCTEDWECNTWTSCINNEKVRSCVDNNNCETKESKPNEWELCGEIEDGTHVVINEKLFYKKTEVHNEINCGNYGLAQGQCNLTIHYYRGIYGEDAEKHFDANGLYVFIASYNNTSQDDFFNSLQNLYGNSPETKSFDNNNYYKNAEGTPEQRAAEPGEADEGVYWVSEDKYILLHHNGIDGDTPDGQKSNMYFNALLEIYTEEYPSDLVFS